MKYKSYFGNQIKIFFVMSIKRLLTNRLKKTVAFCAALILTVCLLTGFFYLIFLSQVRHLQSQILYEIEKNLGFSFSYESIDPHFLSKFNIRGVQIFKIKDGTQQKQDSIKLSSLEVTLNLWKILTFKNDFFVEKVLVKGLELNIALDNINANKDEDSQQTSLEDIVQSFNKNLTNLFYLNPKANFEFYASDVSLILHLPKSGKVVFQTNNISLIINQGDWNFDGSLSLKNSNFSSSQAFLSQLSGEVSLKGFGKISPWQAQLMLSFQGLQGESFQIVDHSYFISLNKDYFRILNNTGEKFTLDILYDLNSNSLQGNFEAKDWRFLDIISTNLYQSSLFKDLSSYPLDVKGNLLYQKGAFSYSLELLGDFLDSQKSIPSEEGKPLFLKLQGNENWMRIENFFFKSSLGGSISFDGYFSLVDLVPRGNIHFSHFLMEDFPPLTGIFSISEDKDDYILKSKSFSLGDFQLGIKWIRFNNNGKILSFDSDIQFLETQNGFMSFNGFYSFKKPIVFNVQIQNLPLKNLFTSLPKRWQSYFPFVTSLSFQNVFVNTQIQAKLDLNNFSNSSIQTFDFSLKDKDATEEGLFLKLKGNKDQVDLQSFKWVSSEIFFNLEGTLYSDLSQKAEALFSLNINGKKTYPILFRWDDLIKTIELTSSHNIQINWQYRDGFNGIISLENFKIPLKKSELLLNQYIVIKSDSNNSWFMDWKKSNIGIKGNSLFPNLFFSWQASATKDVLTVENILLSDSVSEFSGNGVIENWLSSHYKGSIFLSSQLNQEFLEVNCESRDSSFFVHLKSPKILLDHFKNFSLPFKKGDVGLDVSFLWEDEKLSSAGQLFLEKTSFLGSDLSLKSSFAFLDSHLISSNSQFILQDKLFYVDDLNIDFVDKSYTFQGYIDQIINNKREKKRLSRLKSYGNWDLEDSFYTIYLKLDQTEKTNLKGKILDFSLKRQGNSYKIISSDKKSLRGSYDSETGNLSLISSDPYPIQFQANGFILDDLLDLRVENINFEVGNFPLTIRIPQVFSWYSGAVKGNLFIKGTPLNPEFEGALSIFKAVVSTPYVANLSLDNHLEEIKTSPFNGLVLAKGHSIYLLDSSSRLGNSSTLETLASIQTTVLKQPLLMKGVLVISGLELERLQLLIDIPENNKGIPIVYNQTGVRVKGYALGNMFLEVRDDGIDLKGGLTLNQTDISLSEDSSAEVHNLEDFSVTADFNFILGKGVRFIWPNEILPIFRVFFENNQKVSLKFDSQNGYFSLLGDVYMRGGTLTYYSSNFILKKGKISFNETEKRFDPYIEVEAESRVKEKESSEFNIFEGFRSNNNILIKLKVNSALSEMIQQATLSSDPPRSQDQLRVLLGIGDISLEKLTQTKDLGEAGLNLASGLVTNALLRPVEDLLRNTLGLDYFSFSSDLLKRLTSLWWKNSTEVVSGNQEEGSIIGQSSTTSNRLTVDTLTDILDNTRISVGKYIADGIFFESGLSLNKEKTIYLEKTVQANLDFGFELNAKPFIIGWQAGLNLADTLNFNSYINKITLGWSFHY